MQEVFVCATDGCAGARHKARGFCSKCYNASLRARDPEASKAYFRNWRATNRERIEAQYREKAPEILAKQRARLATETPEAREKRLSGMRAYDARTADAKKAREADYYVKHREKRLAYNKEYCKEWRARNRALWCSYSHIRKTRKTNAGGSYTCAEWSALVESVGGRCQCCMRANRTLTADHIIPVKRGGPSFIWNIQPLCRSCNARKGARTILYREGEIVFDMCDERNR